MLVMFHLGFEGYLGFETEVLIKLVVWDTGSWFSIPHSKMLNDIRMMAGEPGKSKLESWPWPLIAVSLEQII